MIYIGTSGFSYEDWRGYFYPKEMDKKGMLDYYSRQFPCVEINSTYYSVSSPFAFAAMARKTPPDFKFSVKAHKDMTHAEEPVPEVFDAFRGSIQPLIETGKLGCVLAQFPWSFKNTPENHDRLRQFKELILDIPTVVELRNVEWVEDQTFELLRELDFGFCSVDEPELKGLMPRIAIATSSTAYIRFHGRNAKEWWQHEEAWMRYNYLYEEEELEEWVPKVKALERETSDLYLFFNNHYRGKSAQNARMFADMLNLLLPSDLPSPASGTLDL